MNRKLPPDAFDFYVNLGPDRSYEKVAEEYGISKRGVTKAAHREDWAGRLAKIEAGARQATDKKLGETIEAMNQRHLKVMKAVLGKALETLKSLPLTNAMDAVRAIDMSLKQERLIRGEPSERTAMTIAETTREEMRRLLVVEEVDEDDDEENGDEEEADEEA